MIIFENQDFFSGVMRFSPILMAVNLMYLIYFIWSWRRTYLKTGWKIDYWHFTMLMSFVIPVLIMYPFNASEGNILSMGSHYYVVEPYINIAYLITLLGFTGMILGRYIFDTFGLNTPFIIIKIMTDPIERMIRYNIKKAFGLRLFALVLLLLMIILFIFQIKYGVIVNVRAFFLENPAYRPIYNFIISLYSIIFVFLFIRYLSFKNKTELTFMITLVLFSLFLGTRGVVFGTILSAYLIYIFSIKGNIKLYKMIIIGFIIMTLALYLGFIRDGNYNFKEFLLNIGILIFYGNNFSDTRDFAWILAYWDYEYVLGKTYLAGLISFIPASLSEYREIWGLGRYTNTYVGFDSSLHAGLRPGIFGEVFFNFGVAGVFILGIISGYLLRYADIRLKRSVTQHNNIIEGYSKVYIFTFISHFFITAGFFSFYVFLFVMIAMYLTNLIIYGIIK